MSGWLGENRKRALKNAAEEAASRRLAELGAVRSDWGVAYDENLEHSERAAKEYALTEHAPKIESAMGTSNWLKLTAQLGHGLGEHAFAFSAPRDDAARASCRNGAKSAFLI